ncbi:MAG: phosphonate metabolism protein PhnM [Bacillota bacterium]|nr:phosphonate metabolism protein PhnM [Bacillota bacterium]
MYLITHGNIVTENGILKGYELLIEEDRIKRIAKEGEIEREGIDKVIDANDGYIAPGFIDIHADYIESMAAPRPSVLMDFNLSLRETEKVLVNQGITTMFHSLSLYKTDEFSHKPIRSSENVRNFVEIINRSHNSKHLIRHRFHARVEIDNVEVVDNVKSYIKENKVHLISFMDHTPGQGQYRDLEIYRNTIKGYKDLSDGEVDSIIEYHGTKEKMTLDTIRELAALAKERNISIASHDDDSIEKLDLAKSFSTTISEFPITIEVAKSARERGMYTIAGAPNILLGGSHAGNLSAAEAIVSGAVDILCSDYYPPALLHAVFVMHEKYSQELHKMFNLVTINPARAVKMDNIIGSIEENKKADIILIEKIEGDFPVITAVFVDGKLITRTNYRI